MKLPRRRFWVPLLLVVALAVCEWFHVHYHLIGCIRGDAYYRGLPTLQLLCDDGTDATVRALLLSSLNRWQGEVSDELCAAARPYLDDSNDATKLSAALFLVKWERNPVQAQERLLEMSATLSQSGSVALRRSLASELAHAAKGIGTAEFPTLETMFRMLQDDGDAFVVEYVAKGRAAMRREQ